MVAETRQDRGSGGRENEYLLCALGALLTECERLRAMGDVAAGRLRRMISDLEGRTIRGEGTSELSRKESGPPAPGKPTSTPAAVLQGIRLERSTPRASRRIVVRHGLVVASAAAFATLWALGIVAEVPQRPAPAPQSEEQAAEPREPERASAAAPTAPVSPARQPRVTDTPKDPAGPPAPRATLPPGMELPPLSAGFVGRAVASPGGQARVSDERPADRARPSATPRPGPTGPSDLAPRRGPSPESP
jgi:hypothetical protein